MEKMPAGLTAPIINENAKVVLARRYQNKDAEGNIVESAQELFWRVASSIAKEEAKYKKSTIKQSVLAKEFYELLVSYRFLPNSPTLMNAGTDLGQLAACFVLPVEDSIEGIFDAVKHAAMIHKSGGGTGFSFSRLRPRDAVVGSTGGVASGPLSFLKIFNCATEQIKQGGTRRGANMGILRVDHPDIMDFIRAKERDGDLNNFNLSIGLTEKFMRAVEAKEDFDLISPKTGKALGKLNALEVFNLLVQKAWESGDPGIVFLDRINRDNPTPQLGEMESTNPCGEQPLLPYEACNLGSVNLGLCYDKEKNEVDWKEMRRIVHLSVRFLDNVIDASRYPLDAITETVKMNRKIGLGIMGWADLLFQMGVSYNSQQGVDLGEQVMKFVRDEARSASKQLAVERDPFPSYDESTFGQANLGPYRNATTTTIAPTGTLSIIAGCSSGVEPLFALSFVRNVMDNDKLVESNPYFTQALKDADAYSAKLMEEVAKIGTIRKIDYLPESLRTVFVTAMDVEPIWHLKMQAAFQKYTDNAVSKTVNLPNDATKEEIWDIYWKSYEYGCKGVTVYRDGSKSTQVLCTGDGDKEKDAAANKENSVVKDRPDVIYGFTQKVETGLGALFVTVNEMDGKPFEVFCTIGKSGGSTTAKAEAIGRLVSLALRAGVEARAIVEQLEGIVGENPKFMRKHLVKSIPDAIAMVFKNRYLDGENIHTESNSLLKDTCPDCGSDLVFEEGCNICKSCAFSKCG